MPSGFKRVYLTPLDAVDTVDKEDVGTLRFEGNKVYKYVKLQNTTATVAVLAGDAVAYNAEVGHSVSQVVSDMTDADAAPVGAGIIQGTVAGVLATAYYCWIQIKGPVTALQTIGDTPVDGQEVSMSTTDKTLTITEYSGTSPNIRQVAACMGIVQDASAKLVALDCLF